MKESAVESAKNDDQRSEAIIQGISERITQKQFETWFRTIRLTFTPPEKVHFAVPNRFHKKWIENHYTNVIIETVRQLANVTPAITIDVNPALRSMFARRNEPPEVPQIVSHASSGGGSVEKEYFGQPLNKDYIFDNYVIGPSNHLCNAAAKAVSKKPGGAYNPLFIHGNSGLGKTHIIQALCHDLKNNGYRVCYLSCEDFTNHFISAIESGTFDSFRWQYRQLDALAIDDVHFLSEKERTQEEFFHTFNTLYNQGKQIILTSDRHPRDIAAIEERLISRFKWGLVIELEPPPLETRIAIVKKKAKMRGVALDDMAAHFIAERIRDNVRELEGAVNRVIYFSEVNSRKIDLALLKEAIVDLMPNPVVARGPDLTSILQIISEDFRLKPADIQSRKQNKSVAYPRQICMYLARECTQYSLEEIGGHFGGRDHTTVHYAIKKIEGMIDKDPQIKHRIDIFKRKLMREAV